MARQRCSRAVSHAVLNLNYWNVAIPELPALIIVSPTLMVLVCRGPEQPYIHLLGPDRKV